ncbi:MAG: amidase, partial [Pseudomonadota bacterium]
MGTGLTDLAYLSATEALAAFRARTLSPVELMGAVIARAEAVEPSLNALPYRFFDAAMVEARRAEARYGDGTARPLEGLPIAIKASSDIEGQPDTRGSLALKEGIATRTATVNARMMAAGGIVHARSATPEFSCTTFCHSRLWGVTRNPWDLAMTPGGSSGGAGAALAAGMATLATGSDIGGSIRVPASCCGVVGVKPPYGRVPGDPPFNLDPFCHNGPMARTVADAALMQNLMAGPDGRDIAVLPAAPLPESFAPVQGMRVALSLDLGLFALEEDVRANTLAAAEIFRGLGAEVEEISLGWGPDILEGAARHLIHIFGASMAPMLARADDLTTYARAFAEAGTQSRPSDLLFAMDAAARAY